MQDVRIALMITRMSDVKWVVAVAIAAAKKGIIWCVCGKQLNIILFSAAGF